MAPSPISTVFFLLLTTTILHSAVLTTAIPPPEYNSFLSALRFRNYHLFANAICTTDIHSDILSGRNFTFFVPIDSSLYSLDMTMSVSDYINVLRFHIVPNYRLTVSDLRQLPYGANPFPTLVPGHAIHVINPFMLELPLSVEGVEIAVPDLYSDENVVVHGLEGTVDFRALVDSANSISGEAQTPMNFFPESHPPSDVRREDQAPPPHLVTGIDNAAFVHAPTYFRDDHAPLPHAVTGIETAAEVHAPTNNREYHAPSPHVVSGIETPVKSHAPSPHAVTGIETVVKAHAPSPHIVSGIETAASPRSKVVVTGIDTVVSGSQSLDISQAAYKVSGLVAPQTRVESISHPLEEHRSELITHKIRGSESATQSVQRHMLSELNVPNIHDVSLAARSETRGNDAEEVNQVFDELRTGTSELISENLRHVSLAARSILSGNDAEEVSEAVDELRTGTSGLISENLRHVSLAARSILSGNDAEEVSEAVDELRTGTSGLISENLRHVSLAAKYSGDDVEGFSLMDDNKMIDCATAVEDGEQYSRIDEISLGDPYRRELYTPATMICAN